MQQRGGLVIALEGLKNTFAGQRGCQRHCAPCQQLCKAPAYTPAFCAHAARCMHAQSSCAMPVSSMQPDRQCSAQVEALVQMACNSAARAAIVQLQHGGVPAGVDSQLRAKKNTQRHQAECCQRGGALNVRRLKKEGSGNAVQSREGSARDVRRLAEEAHAAAGAEAPQAREDLVCDDGDALLAAYLHAMRLCMPVIICSMLASAAAHASAQPPPHNAQERAGSGTAAVVALVTTAGKHLRSSQSAPGRWHAGTAGPQTPCRRRPAARAR